MINHDRGSMLAVALSIIGCIFSSCGVCIQRSIHKQIAADPSIGPASSHKNFFVGLIYFSIGVICNTINDGLLPLSVSSVFSTQSIAYTMLLESSYINITISSSDKLSISLILSSFLIIVASGDISDPVYDLDMIMSQFLAPPSIIFSAFLLTIMCCLIPATLTCSNNPPIHLLVLSLSAAIASSLSSTIIKSCVELTYSSLLHSSGDFYQYQTWILVLLLTPLSLLKLNLVSKGLSHYSPLLFMPVYSTLSVTMHILCGSVFFREHTENEWGFIIGSAVAIFGVFATITRFDSVNGFSWHSSQSLLSSQQEYDPTALSGELDPLILVEGSAAREMHSVKHNSKYDFL